MNRSGEGLKQSYPQLITGLGAEYLINNQLGIQASVQYHYTLSDELDQVQQGQYNDYFYSASVGVNIYFGRQIE